MASRLFDSVVVAAIGNPQSKTELNQWPAAAATHCLAAAPASRRAYHGHDFPWPRTGPKASSSFKGISPQNFPGLLFSDIRVCSTKAL